MKEEAGLEAFARMTVKKIKRNINAAGGVDDTPIPPKAATVASRRPKAGVAAAYAAAAAAKGPPTAASIAGAAKSVAMWGAGLRDRLKRGVGAPPPRPEVELEDELEAAEEEEELKAFAGKTFSPRRDEEDGAPKTALDRLLRTASSFTGILGRKK